MDDVYLLNNPFTFQAMEKHSAYCALMRLGIRVPETWLIPHKVPPAEPALPADRGAVQRGVRRGGDRRPDRLPAVHEAVRRRAVGRCVTCGLAGGAACAVRRVGRADDAPADGARGLRRLRPLALDRRGDDVDVVRPVQADARPVPGTARLPHAGARRGGDHDLAARERVLPLGVQLVRDDREGRDRVSDRLRERVAGRRAHLAALLLPLGDEGARTLVGVLRGHAARDAREPELTRLLRLGRPRRPELRGEARRSTASSPTRTSRSRSTRSSAQAIWGTSTRSRTSGSRRPSSTACSSRRCARRSRRTSTTTSSRTTAGCSQPGRATMRRCRLTRSLRLRP